MATAAKSARAHIREQQSTSKKRKTKQHRGPGRVREPSDGDANADNVVERGAFTIAEFCARYRLSPASFFALKKAGRGPRVFHPTKGLGKKGGTTKVLISVEAAQEWVRQQEQEPIAS